MTSNIGSQILEEAGDTDFDGKDDETGEVIEAALRQAMRRHFRPEFLNRIDEIVVFQSLSREALEKIVDLQLEEASRRLAGRKVQLEVDQKAREFLALEGYEPTYGARPLRRAIQRHLLDPLSLALLEEKFKEGDTVHVTTDGSEETLEIS